MALCLCGLLLACGCFWLIIAHRSAAVAGDPRGRTCRGGAGRTYCARKYQPRRWQEHLPDGGRDVRDIPQLHRPSSFDLDSSILLLTMVVVGGARTLAGSIVGLSCCWRCAGAVDAGHSTTIAAAARQLIMACC